MTAEVSDSSCVDTGDTAWVMFATVLVLGMMPGLAFFESGLLGRKNVLSIISQVFLGICTLGVMWFLFGFTLVFGDDVGGFIGNFHHAAFRNLTGCLPVAPKIAGISYAMFQLMFATITPILMTGAFAERLRIKAFLVLIVLWEILVYYPVAHWIWHPDGFLAQWGVIDFAGGIVIHATSGASALVICICLGRRRSFDRYHGEFPHHNIPLAAIGAASLWTGWYGFNAGSALTAGTLAAQAVANTTVASCTGGIVMALLSFHEHGLIRTVDILNGVIAGMAGITPASGYIHTYYSFVVGIACTLGAWYGIKLFKGKLRIDDALDVSSVHGVTGVVGALSIGFFAEKAINPHGHDGVVAGNPRQLYVQLGGLCLAIAWACFWSFLIIMGLRYWGRKWSAAKLHHVRVGLDQTDHGQAAYDDVETDDAELERGSVFNPETDDVVAVIHSHSTESVDSDDDEIGSHFVVNRSSGHRRPLLQRPALEDSVLELGWGGAGMVPQDE